MGAMKLGISGVDPIYSLFLHNHLLLLLPLSIIINEMWGGGRFC